MKSKSIPTGAVLRRWWLFPHWATFEDSLKTFYHYHVFQSFALHLELVMLSPISEFIKHIMITTIQVSFRILCPSQTTNKLCKSQCFRATRVSFRSLEHRVSLRASTTYVVLEQHVSHVKAGVLVNLISVLERWNNFHVSLGALEYPRISATSNLYPITLKRIETPEVSYRRAFELVLERRISCHSYNMTYVSLRVAGKLCISQCFSKISVTSIRVSISF